MQIWLKVISVLIIFFTALPLVPKYTPLKKQWWTKLFDFPRIQLAYIGVINIVLILCLMNTTLYTSVDFFILAFFIWAVYIQIKKVIPYTKLYAYKIKKVKDEGPSDILTILTCNVRMKNRKSAPFRDLVNGIDPDIICVLEPDKWWENEIREFEISHPYFEKCAIGNTYGMLLYSKLKFKHSKTRFLFSPEIPSMKASIELPSGNVIDLFCVHPVPPVPFEDLEEIKYELLHVAEEVRDSANPCLIVGDLNDVAWSKLTKRILKIGDLIDPRVGRGFLCTYNAFIPIFRYPIDHIFYTKEFEIVKMERLSKVNSDHFPMLMTLKLHEHKINEYRGI